MIYSEDIKTLSLAIIFSLFMHFGGFLLFTSNVSEYKSADKPLNMSFFQEKWSEKNVEFPGKKEDMSFLPNERDLFAHPERSGFSVLESQIFSPQPIRYYSWLRNMQIASGRPIVRIPISTRIRKILSYSIPEPVPMARITLHDDKIEWKELDEWQKILNVRNSLKKLKAADLGIKGPVSEREVKTHPSKDELVIFNKNKNPVIIKFRIGALGEVLFVEIEKSSGDRTVDMNAIRWMRKWRFAPKLTGVQRGEDWGIISLEYSIMEKDV